MVDGQTCFDCSHRIRLFVIAFSLCLHYHTNKHRVRLNRVRIIRSFCDERLPESRLLEVILLKVLIENEQSICRKNVPRDMNPGWSVFSNMIQSVACVEYIRRRISLVGDQMSILKEFVRRYVPHRREHGGAESLPGGRINRLVCVANAYHDCKVVSYERVVEGIFALGSLMGGV